MRQRPQGNGMGAPTVNIEGVVLRAARHRDLEGTNRDVDLGAHDPPAEVPTQDVCRVDPRLFQTLSIAADLTGQQKVSFGLGDQSDG